MLKVVDCASLLRQVADVIKEQLHDFRDEQDRLAEERNKKVEDRFEQMEQALTQSFSVPPAQRAARAHSPGASLRHRSRSPLSRQSVHWDSSEQFISDD